MDIVPEEVNVDYYDAIEAIVTGRLSAQRVNLLEGATVILDQFQDRSLNTDTALLEGRLEKFVTFFSQINTICLGKFFQCPMAIAVRSLLCFNTFVKGAIASTERKDQYNLDIHIRICKEKGTH